MQSDINGISSWSQYVACCLSMLGCMLVLQKFFQAPSKNRTYQFKLVAMLQGVQCFWCVFTIIQMVIQGLTKKFFTLGESSPFCTIQAYLKAVQMYISFACNCIIGYSLLRILIYKVPLDKKISNPFKHFILFTVVIPFTVPLIPIATGNYISENPYYPFSCWMSNQMGPRYSLPGKEWQSIVGSIELLCLEFCVWLGTTIFMSYVVIRIQIRMREWEKHQLIEESVKRSVRSLMIYPVIIALCWLPIEAKRFVQIITPATQNNPLSFLDAFDYPLVTLEGFFDGIAYFWLTFQTVSEQDSELEDAMTEQFQEKNSENTAHHDEESSLQRIVTPLTSQMIQNISDQRQITGLKSPDDHLTQDQNSKLKSFIRDEPIQDRSMSWQNQQQATEVSLIKQNIGKNDQYFHIFSQDDTLVKNSQR